MAQVITVLGSVTVATRLLREVQKNGALSSTLIRTPIKISRGSCSYSVKAEEKYLKIIKGTAAKQKIKIKGIYREILREGECEYDDLS